jgi:hypothetical protein
MEDLSTHSVNSRRRSSELVGPTPWSEESKQVNRSQQMLPQLGTVGLVSNVDLKLMEGMP